MNDDRFENYKDWVDSRVVLKKGIIDNKLVLGGFGLAGEVGEVVDHLKKYLFHGKALDIKAIRLEMGDVLWYYALLCRELGFSLEEIMATNKEKLLARDGQNNEKFFEARNIT